MFVIIYSNGLWVWNKINLIDLKAYIQSTGAFKIHIVINICTFHVVYGNVLSKNHLQRELKELCE